MSFNLFVFLIALAIITLISVLAFIIYEKIKYSCLQEEIVEVVEVV
jgi:hypothetical protein